MLKTIVTVLAFSLVACVTDPTEATSDTEAAVTEPPCAIPEPIRRGPTELELRQGGASAVSAVQSADELVLSEGILGLIGQ